MSTPAERVMEYFDKPDLDKAVRALRSYYGADHHYTGAAFDQIVSESRPDRFTSEDMLAVSMLSVNVPARAALHLIQSDDVRRCLIEIPLARTLWDAPSLLDRDGHAWRLWDLVSKEHDIGPTIGSKLLAAKRPALIPVHDQHMARALDFGSSEWGFWQQVAQSPEASRLTSAVQTAMTDAEAPGHVTVLRAIDVVIWMRVHGWRTHDVSKCTIGCDFSSF